MKKPKVALVVGAGGIKCAAALGLIKVLRQADLMPDILVGCSGGAIMCTLLALGYNDDEMQSMTINLWRREVMTDFSRRSLLKILFPRWFGYDADFALVHDTPMLTTLNSWLQDRHFSDCRLPLFLAATDQQNGTKVILDQGPLLDAIRASIAIPILFGPYQVGGRWLIDGGLSDPLPVDIAIREGADLIIAMGFEAPYAEHIRSLPSNILQMSSIFINNLARSQFSFYNAVHHAEIVPLIVDFDRPIQLFDTHLIPHIIEVGAQIAQQNLPTIRTLFEQLQG